MTSESMVNELQNVYNFKYNDTQIRYIYVWLNKTTNVQRNFLLAELLNFFSPTNACPLPLIAELNKAWKIVTGNRWHEVLKIEARNKPQVEEQTITTEEAKENIARVYEIIGSIGDAKRVRGEGEGE